MSAFCEHGRVKTTCPECRRDAVGPVSAIVDKMFELASQHAAWKTLSEGKPFDVAIATGGLTFVPDQGMPRHESRGRLVDAVLQLEKEREAGETPHRKHIQSWATGSYILRLYAAVLWPAQYGAD